MPAEQAILSKQSIMQLRDRFHRRLPRFVATAAILVSGCRTAPEGPTATPGPGATSTAMVQASTGGATVPPQAAGDLATRAAPHMDDDARGSVADLAGKAVAARDGRSLLNLCMGIYAGNMLDVAAECFELTRLALPDDAQPQYFLGRVAEQSGDLDAARDHYRQAAAMAPDLAFLHWREGLASLAQADLDAAEAAFRRAKAIDPAALGPQAGLARVAMQRGDAQLAVDLLIDLEAGDPREVRYLQLLLATAFERVGRSEDAARLRAEGDLSQTSTSSPWSDPWNESLAQYAAGFGADMRRTSALLEAGDTRTVIPMLEDLMTRYPDRDEVVLRLATAYGMEGDMARSREHFQRLVDKGSSRGFALEGLSRTYLLEAEKATGDVREQLLAKALEAAEAAIADPQSPPSAQGLKGDALKLRGDREGALAAYRLAAAAEPGKLEWRLGIARMLLLERRWEEAAEAAEAAIAVDPTAVQAWSVLAFAQAHLDDAALAQASLQRALALAPGDNQVLAAATEVAGMGGGR